MIKYLNLGNEKLTIDSLTELRKRKLNNYDIRITNSHISKLNTILKKKVFKKETLYISSEALWEIMQPVGDKGKHNYHGLTPQNIFDALVTMKQSTEIEVSYDNRYLIVTLATVFDDINLVVIVTPMGYLKTIQKQLLIESLQFIQKRKNENRTGLLRTPWILYHLHWIYQVN